MLPFQRVGRRQQHLKERLIPTFRQILHAVRWARRHRRGQMRVPELSIISRFIRPEDVVIDVGAHGGAWTGPLSRLVPHGHVFAFEALPYYATVLRLTARLLGWKNVTILNQAATDRPQRLELVFRDAAGRHLTGTTHVSGRNEQGLRQASGGGVSVEVEGVTLDQFRSQRQIKAVRFIKIDVEGFELPVLRGAARLIEECRPLLWCELWSAYTQRYGYSTMDLFAFLTERNYRAFLIEEGAGLVETDAANYPDQRDILAVPAEVNLAD